MDLANLWTPTRVTAIGNGRYAADAARMVGGLTEQTGYFGAGLLALVVVFAVVFRGTRVGWLLPTVFAGVLVCALGSHITLHGVERWRGPWLLVSKLPLLHLALPSRFPVYAWLAVAVMCALLRGAAPRARGSRGRWCCSRCCRSCRRGRPTCGRRRCRCRRCSRDGPRAVGDPRRQRRDGAAVVVPRPRHALADGVGLPVPAGRRLRGLAGARLLLAVSDRALVLRPAPAARRGRRDEPVPAATPAPRPCSSTPPPRTAGMPCCAPPAGPERTIGGVLVYRRT